MSSGNKPPIWIDLVSIRASGTVALFSIAKHFKGTSSKVFKLLACGCPNKQPIQISMYTTVDIFKRHTGLKSGLLRNRLPRKLT